MLEYKIAGKKKEKKEPNFLPSNCISLLLRSKPVQTNCLHIFKIFKRQSEL